GRLPQQSSSSWAVIVCQISSRGGGRPSASKSMRAARRAATLSRRIWPAVAASRTCCRGHPGWFLPPGSGMGRGILSSHNRLLPAKWCSNTTLLAQLGNGSADRLAPKTGNNPSGEAATGGGRGRLQRKVAGQAGQAAGQGKVVNVLG